MQQQVRENAELLARLQATNAELRTELEKLRAELTELAAASSGGGAAPNLEDELVDFSR